MIISKTHKISEDFTGTITPGVVECMKIEIVEEIVEDILDFLKADLFIKWHIDSEARTVRGTLDFDDLDYEERVQ